eukprot:896975-Amphidinium_carterae.1
MSEKLVIANVLVRQLTYLSSGSVWSYARECEKRAFICHSLTLLINTESRMELPKSSQTRFARAVMYVVGMEGGTWQPEHGPWHATSKRSFIPLVIHEAAQQHPLPRGE